MKYYSVFLVLFFVFALHVPVFSQHWELSWSDEFNGNNLDTAKWNYEIGNGQGGWGTGQIDYCTDRKKNVLVKDGKLILTLRKEPMGGLEYTAGRINTHEKYAVKYGKIDMRAKIPAGRGLGAAIWMLSEEEKFGWWPRSGEIDILETNGHEHNRNYGTVHYMKDGRHQHSGHDVITNGNLTTEFHDYTFIWNEVSMKWYLDGVLFNEVSIKEPIDNRMPFNEAFYFILSTGVGSQFSGKNIEDSIMPQTLEVDYLRVYKEYSIPELVAAKTSYDGKYIELSFSEELKNLAASYKEFILKNNNTVLITTNAELKDRDRRTLIVELKDVVDKNAVLTVSYVNGDIQSMSRRALKDFSGKSIVNNLEGAPPVIHTLQTGLNSFSVQFECNKVLASLQVKKEQFILNVNGKTMSILSAERGLSNTSMIILTTEKPFFKGDTILLSYVGTEILSADNGVLKTFQNLSVQNTLIQKFVLPGIIEAENYIDHSDTKTDRCIDEGKGTCVIIDNSGWMDYEVYVEKDGIYTVSYRIAPGTKEGSVSLKMNNSVLNQINVLSAYRPDAWTTLSSGSLSLKKGIYRIRVETETGGLKLNWIKFVTN